MSFCRKMWLKQNISKEASLQGIPNNTTQPALNFLSIYKRDSLQKYLALLVQLMHSFHSCFFSYNLLMTTSIYEGSVRRDQLRSMRLSIEATYGTGWPKEA